VPPVTDISSYAAGVARADAAGLPAPGSKLLEVSNLSTHFFTPEGVVQAVDEVSFELDYGETLGLVGESGCGKSVTALSITRLVPNPPGRIVAGEVLFGGVDVLKLSDEEMRQLRGKEIGFIFQDPQTSLNPTLTIGYQIAEPIRAHLGLSAKAAADRSAELLGKVGIPRAKDRLGDYPHQFSGGMRQRVMIAIALSCNPKLILADEPTTALDVTIQAQILELIKKLSQEFRTAVLLITHDLGIAAGMCDRVNVMYAGRIVETGTVDELFENPLMPYAWGLLDSLPRIDDVRGDRLRTIEGMPPFLVNPGDTCRFRPRCGFGQEACRPTEPMLTERGTKGHMARCWATETGTPMGDAARGEDQVSQVYRESTARHISPENLVEVDNLKVYFPIRSGIFQTQKGTVKAVDDISFEIRRGETFGLVGESGCGKSTTGRAILRLREPTAGAVKFDGIDLLKLRTAELRKMRRRMQIIFQDPYGSLDPRMPVSAIIGEALETHGLGGGPAREARIAELLEMVGLSANYMRRYPHEFSGGQRQRIGVARALAVEPEFIVCDEPISALDVSIQAQVLNLLTDLRDQLGLTYFFIAHDLSVVRHISDRIAVMYLGKIVELGPPDMLYAGPGHPYTRALLSAVPVPDPKTERRRKRVILSGEVPSPVNPPAGCRFHTRCWLYERLGAPEECRTVDPELRVLQGDHRAACHYAEDALKTDVGLAHVDDRPVRRGTPASALAQMAALSKAEAAGSAGSQAGGEGPPAARG
jgi:peptide/nickel transport system ATP-binding protein